NDQDRHSALQYATAVWHYPQPEYSRPATPVDLFCCGHAFLPDGRLLASGGTERYDPFFGLRQAVTFDPQAGPADPVSPPGPAGSGTAEPDMARGRWYPTLIALQDGRMAAVSGQDENNELNVVPENSINDVSRYLSVSPFTDLAAGQSLNGVTQTSDPL